MTQNKIGTVALMLTANAQGVANGVSSALGSVSNLFSGIAKFASRTASISLGILSAKAFSAAVSSAKELAQWAIKTAEEYEQAEIAFQVMTGSKSKGTALLGDLQQLAVETPFKSSEVIAQAKLLKAYGVDTEDLIKTISQLGDVAAGTGVDINRLGLAYGQVISKGRFQASELRQFTEAGVGLSQFAKAAGVSNQQLLANMEAGTVGSEVVVKAFENMTMKGGMFFQLMEKQSQTVKGRVDSFVESVEILVGKVGLLAFKAFGVRDFFDSLAKGVQSINVAGVGGWLDRAGDGLKPFYDGLVAMIESGKELAKTIMDISGSWKDAKQFFHDFVQIAIPMVHDLTKSVVTLGLAIAQLGVGLGLPDTEKLSVGRNKLMKAIDKRKEELDQLKQDNGISDTSYFSNLFNQPSSDVTNRIKTLTAEIERGAVGLKLIDAELERIDAAAQSRQRYTLGLSNLMPSREEAQKTVDRFSELLNGIDRGRDAAIKKFSELSNGTQGKDANYPFMDFKDIGDEAIAGARIMGENFQKTFSKELNKILPNFKMLMDGMNKEVNKFGKEETYGRLVDTMKSIALAEQMQMMGLENGLSADAAARERVSAFEQFKKASGIDQIRNMAPLIETNSQAAVKALNDFRSGGTSVESDIKAGREAQEAALEELRKLNNEIKSQKDFKPPSSPLLNFLAVKVGGG